MKEFKVGDKIRYIGPKRGNWGNPKDHPSYYTDYKIEEKGRLEGRFRTSCVEVENPEVVCGGWKYVDEREWELI